MDRNSNVTQLGCLDKEGPHPFPTDDLPPSSDTEPPPADSSRHALASKKDVAGKLRRKQKRPIADDAHKAAESKFQKPTNSASRGVRLDPQTNIAPANDWPSKPPPDGSHDASSSSRPGVLPGAPPLRVKDGSPWGAYDRDYQLELGGLVTVAGRRRPASGLVVIKELPGSSADATLSTLRQIQGSCFGNCVEIVAAPRYPNENQVAAIIGQVLRGIEFLESRNMVHGTITCSSVLVSQQGAVKIANLECCRTASLKDKQDHPDVRALGDIMMQLIEKHSRGKGLVSASDLPRWSPTVANFLSDTTSASAKELAQPPKHAFLKNEWRKEDLLSLISLAQLSSRRFYRDGW